MAKRIHAERMGFTIGEKTYLKCILHFYSELTNLAFLMLLASPACINHRTLSLSRYLLKEANEMDLLFRDSNPLLFKDH